MTKQFYFPKLNLQLFAEGTGGDGGNGTGAEGSTAASETLATSQTKKGVKSNPLANVKYGIQEDSVQVANAQSSTTTESNPVDRNAMFEQLIKGEYKDLYDAKVQDTIQKRLKGSKETEAKLNALSPTLELLARKYGVDVNNVEALNKAIEEDDAYYEDEALEKGVTVEQLKEVKKMERELAELRQKNQARDRAEQAEKLYAQWMQQEAQAKAIYPSLDLRTELQNPNFARLLNANIDVKTAFEVIHKDDIIPAAMQYTAKTVEQKLTNSIIANAKRPVENGSSSQSSATTKSDVSKLTKADRAEIIRRVQRGDIIRF